MRYHIKDNQIRVGLDDISVRHAGAVADTHLIAFIMQDLRDKFTNVLIGLDDQNAGWHKSSRLGI